MIPSSTLSVFLTAVRVGLAVAGVDVAAATVHRRATTPPPYFVPSTI